MKLLGMTTSENTPVKPTKTPKAKGKAKSNAKKIFHDPSKTASELNRHERVAAFGRLKTALKSADVPEIIRQRHVEIQGIVDHAQRNKDMGSFLAAWLKGCSMQA
jgi:hypothetical protein